MADITGTSGNDILNGTLGTDYIQGLEGDDLINPGLGYFDNVDGGDGTDTLKLDYSSLNGEIYGYLYDNGADGYYGSYQSYGTEGYNYIDFNNIEKFDLTGGGGNDTLIGGANSDILNGGAGDDQIDGRGGADTIDGGAGEDGLLGVDYSTETTARTLSDATPITTTLTFANGTMATNVEFIDGVTTGSGDDTINYSRYRTNTINTGAGNDVINPGLGYFDNVDGGDGSDTLKLDYSSLDNGIYSYGSYDNGAGSYRGQYYGYSSTTGYHSVNFNNIEKFDITGGGGNDTLIGGANSDILNGGGGNDTLIGGANSDILNGGAGDDQIDSGGGADTIDGGAGEDGLLGVDYSTETTARTLSDATPITTTLTFANGTTATNVEFIDSVTTGSGDDIINYSRYRTNTINTGAGNDVINPGLGYFDNVDGGDGSDTFKLDYSSLDNGIYSYGLYDNGAGSYSGQYYGYSSTEDYNSVNFNNIEKFDITGGGGNDTLIGGANSDILNGGAGDDLIDGRGGADTIDGGAGEDGLLGVDYSTETKKRTLSDATPITTPLTFANGTTATNVEFIDGVTTGSGDDIINYSRYRTNTINTGAGNDVINPGLGYFDNVAGGDGTDTLKLDYSSLNGEIYGYLYDNGAGGYYGSYQGYGTEGYNYIDFNNIEKFDITGGGGNDTLIGGANSDILNGGAGDDLIDGRGGADTIDGGAGEDGLLGVDYSTETKKRTLSDATPITTTLTFANGTTATNVEFIDSVTTGSGKDTINYSRYRTNTINTGAGNDVINPGLGNSDNVDGGDGTDTLKLDYSSLNGGIYGYLYDNGAGGYYGSYQGYGTEGYNSVNFNNIEKFDLTGGGGNDTLIGGANSDILNGGAGDDLIDGRGGADTIDGGAGEDGLLGVDYSTETKKRTLSDATPITTPLTFANGTTATNVEFIDGVTTGSGDDIINYSRYRTNTINTGAGNDVINPGLGYFDNVAGGDGTDTLKLDYSSLNGEIYGYLYDNGAGGYYGSYQGYGTEGYNYIDFNNIEKFDLTGGGGNDTLIGGNGDDILVGGGGNDVLTGNMGNDKSLYNTNAAFATSAIGIDTISDFTSGDKIVLDKTTFNALTSAIGTGFSVATEFATIASDAEAAISNALIVYNSATGSLFYNQNKAALGFGTGAQFATISGENADPLTSILSASDFLIQA